MKGKKDKGELTVQFFRFTVPTILSMLVFSLYTMIDGMFVAKGVGEKAMAAVNLSSPFNAVMFSSGLLIAVGMSTVISIRLGKGEKESASQLFTQNLLVSFLVGLFISSITLLKLGSLACFLGATSDTLDYVKGYVGVIAIFAVFFMGAYNMEILVKTDGAPQLAVFGVTAAGLTNIVLDWLFVMKFAWGVKGAAFATGLAQMVSMAIYVVYFLRFSKQIFFRRFSWNIGIYRKTLPLGLADGVTEFSNGVVLFLFNKMILRFLGEDGVVSYTVVGYVNTFVLMLMLGTAQGVQPICSFYYGKNEKESYEHLLKLSMGMAFIFGFCGWVVSTMLGGKIVNLFIQSDSALFAPSVTALGTYSFAFLFMGFNVISVAFFTSIARASLAFPISLGRGLVFPAISVMLLPIVLGAEKIWYAGALAECLCLVLSAVLMMTYQKQQKG